MDTYILAAKDDLHAGHVFGAIVGCIGLLVLVLYVIELIHPRQFGGRMRRFFGRRAYGKLETHDKSFPAYDLASVSRALDSFRAECCERTQELGAVPYGVDSLRRLMDQFATSKPSKPPHERMPVDVETEESFPSNCVHLAVLKPQFAPDGQSRKVAIFILSQSTHTDYGSDLESASLPPSTVALSIACHSKDVADRFFREIEQRRKRLSVYRGKVIDPVIEGRQVRSIGFRKIEKVDERDLVLPEHVKRLVHNSILGFYRHQEALRGVGVEMKRGILFHSPPGTGKTSISLYLARLLGNFTVCFVSGERLMYPREVCRMARYLQPAMVVFEDIDLIATERDMNGLATVLGELMNQIDGCDPDDQLLFVMNTNSMERIEQAVRNRPGRVDQIINIGLPDDAARRELLRYFARNLKVEPADLDRAAAAMEGATPAALKEVVKRAAVNALDRDGNAEPGDGIRITAHDLMFAHEQIQFARPLKAGSSEIL